MKTLPPLFLAVAVQSLAYGEYSQKYEGTFRAADGTPTTPQQERPISPLESAEWRTDGETVLSPPDRAVPGGEKSGSAWAQFPAAADRVVARATIDPRGTDWTALALGGRWGSAFYDTAQLWVLLKPTGDYQVRANGTKLTLKSGHLRSIPTGGAEVEVSYSAGDNAVEVSIGGKKVLSPYSLHGDKFIPVCDSAGFRFNGPIEPAAPASVSGFSAEFSVPPNYSASVDEPLRVFLPGREIAGHCKATFISGGPIRWKAQLVDFYGGIAWESGGEGAVKNGAFEARLQIPPPSSVGYFELRAAFSDEGGTELGTAKVPLAIIPPVPEEARGSGNHFGAMVYPHIAYPWADREKDSELMERIGVRYVRTGRLNWAHAQKGADAPLSWGELDREVELYRKRGLEIIATVGWPTPIWASQASGQGTGSDAGNFLPTENAMPAALRFYGELAKRYRGQIALYEIGNEVDAYFWLGSLKNYLAHDAEGIMRDYFTYFSSIEESIRASDPDALLAPSTTSDMPEGHMYRPWLKSQLDFGLGNAMSAFATHYDSDLEAVNSMLRDKGCEKPVYFTEIGGIARGAVDTDAPGQAIREIIRGDYRQMTEQLRYPNVRALCKFLFREQPTYGGEGHLAAGLLDADFSIRPAYPAYATLIRHLAGAKFVGELNLGENSEDGWVRGLSFERNGEKLAALFLDGAEKSKVWLRCGEGPVSLIDVMGNETPLSPRGGWAELAVDNLPVLVRGEIFDNEGEIVPPHPILVREVDLTPRNPGFEEGLGGWEIMTDESRGGRNDSGDFSVSSDTKHAAEGKQSACFSAPNKTRWYGITQNLPLEKIPRPGPGEFVIFKIEFLVKGDNVAGKGIGYTLAFRDKKRERLSFCGSPYFGFGGSFDWKELSQENRINSWQPNTESVSLDILLALSTGKAWVDNVRVKAQLWREELPHKTGQGSTPRYRKE